MLPSPKQRMSYENNPYATLRDVTMGSRLFLFDATADTSHLSVLLST